MATDTAPANGSTGPNGALSPYLAMLVGSLSFAAMGELAHALGPVCGWPAIAVARTGLVLVLVGVPAVATGVPLVLWRPRTLWVRSVAGSVSMVGTFFAFTRLPVADVLTLTNMFPVWVALLSWPVLGERPPGRVWLAVASGVLGVLLIQQPHLAEGNFAALVALACSLFTAAAMLGLHRLQGIDVRAVVVHFSAVSLLFALGALAMARPEDRPQQSLDGQAYLMLLGIGVAATVGQLFLTRAFAAGTPSKVAVVSLTQILFAVALDVLLFGRRLNPATLVGMGLVAGPSGWLIAARG